MARVKDGTTCSARPVHVWNLEYTFDKEIVKKVSKDLSDFERMFLALKSDGVSGSNIARHLEINPYTLHSKTKRLILKISHQIKDHYKNDLPVPYGRVEALLRECKEEGSIFYPENNTEFKRAYIEGNRYSHIGARKNNILDKKKVEALVREYLNNRRIPSIADPVQN